MRVAIFVVVLWGTLAWLLPGCTSNQGPFVRDVHQVDGRTVVETCTLRLTTYPVLVNVLAPKMEWRNCASADVDAGVTATPAPAAPKTPQPAPASQ